MKWPNKKFIHLEIYFSTTSLHHTKRDMSLKNMTWALIMIEFWVIFWHIKQIPISLFLSPSSKSSCDLAPHMQILVRILKISKCYQNHLNLSSMQVGSLFSFKDLKINFQRIINLSNQFEWKTKWFTKYTKV